LEEKQTLSADESAQILYYRAKVVAHIQRGYHEAHRAGHGNYHQEFLADLAKLKTLIR
jgi:hypothetical protein